MKARQKQMRRDQKAANAEMKGRMKTVDPSDPRVTSGVEPAPPPMPSVFNPVEPAPANPSEPVVPPVTVSASNEIMATNPRQPSPPYRLAACHRDRVSIGAKRDIGKNGACHLYALVCPLAGDTLAHAH